MHTDPKTLPVEQTNHCDEQRTSSGNLDDLKIEEDSNQVDPIRIGGPDLSAFKKLPYPRKKLDRKNKKKAKTETEKKLGDFPWTVLFVLGV